MEKLVLHEYARSGNCYKIRLTSALLGLPIERREYDILKGETRTPTFLAEVNANGRIPVLQIGERFLPESNAACFYLASGGVLIPDDAFDRADMLRWMFFEQYNHEPNVATLRFWLAFLGDAGMSAEQKAAIPARRAAGEAALDVMEEHLAARTFFVGERLTLADIALFAYTHVAGEGGFDLSRWPAIGAWIARVAATPAYISIDA
ncbi:MAG: glutathione S-transferase family protein [Sphingomonas bacterium]|jgi:glutathione S-transferase|nr:glutathione S-transferase family protein [Sphingomonas bacterium]